MFTQISRTQEQGWVTFRVHILPQPRVQRITPVIAPPTGQTPITVHGMFFDQRWREMRATCSSTSPQQSCVANSGDTHQGNTTVAFVDGTACLSTTFVSDEELICIVPPGFGLRNVTVSVYEGPVAVRSGVMPSALAQGVLYYGGAVSGSRGGFFGAHVGGLSRGAAVVAGERGDATMVDNSVRAIAVLRGKLFIGGNFIMSAGGQPLHYVAELSGNGAATPLGGGLDGPVNVLTVFRDTLIVGGGFARVVDLAGASKQGRALATWDGARWGTLGGEEFNGMVSTLLVNGTTLYVAGRFHDSGK
jgi:hypothetical protein